MTKTVNNNQDNDDTIQSSLSASTVHKEDMQQTTPTERTRKNDQQLISQQENQVSAQDQHNNNTPLTTPLPTTKNDMSDSSEEDQQEHMNSEEEEDEDDEEMTDAQGMEGNDDEEEEVVFSSSPLLENVHLADSDIWLAPIMDPTPFWLAEPDWATDYHPYVTDDIHGTGDCDPDDSLTSQLEIGMEYLETDASGSGITTVTEWMHIYGYAFGDEAVEIEDCRKLRNVALRLAQSDPMVLFPSSSWKQGRLLMNHDSHSAWIASYLIFGAPWKNGRDKFVSEKPKSTPSKRNARGQPKAPHDVEQTTKPIVPITDHKVGFAFQSNDTTKNAPATPLQRNLPSKNPLYLNKPLIINPYKTKQIKKMKDHGRKHKTYIKVKMAKTTAVSMTEQQEEISASFSSIMNKIWNIDPSALLLAWKDGMGTDKPLKQNSEFPKTKEQMLRYVDRMWMERLKSAYCRMIINHDKDSDKLFNDPHLQTWLDDNEMSVQIERIQATKTACAGHLLGYQPFGCNTNNLSDAIEQLPLMKGISVEVRSEFVVLGDPKNKTPQKKEKTKTRILKIYVAWNQTGAARQALLKIYSSKGKKRFPQGVMARFIPDIADTRFVRTGAQVLAHRNSLLKHIKFMDATMTHASYNIIELDHYQPKMRMTLRQAVMHIFSSSKPKWNLFLSVDTSYSGDSVIFSFRSELQDEAINMISALPLFLESMTGKQAVWSWFTRDARDEAAHYIWDKEKGIVPVAEMDCTDTILEDWEQLDDVDEEDDQEIVEFQPFKLNLDNLGQNTYGDAGTIATDILAGQTELAEQADTSHQDTPPSSIITNPGRRRPNRSEESTAPTDASTTSPTAQTPSTLTQTPEVSSILEHLTKDPEMIKKFAAMIAENNRDEGASAKAGAKAK
jgi:hypothetical protein